MTSLPSLLNAGTPLKMLTGDQMAAARICDYKLIRLHGKQSVLKDLSSTEVVTFKLMNEKLNRWKMKLKKPIWIEPEEWNTVTWMIYEDLLNNKAIRVQTPADLKLLK